MIQKLKREFKEIPEERFVSELEKFIDRQYRRKVLTLPDPSDRQDSYYEMLIAFRPVSGDLSLFLADRLSLKELSGFQCIGWDWRKSAFVHKTFAELVSGDPATVNLEDHLNIQRSAGDPLHPPPLQEDEYFLTNSY